MRVLLIHTGWLGDQLLTVPLIRRLTGDPRVGDVGLLTTTAGAELLADLPGVDRVHRFAKRRHRAHVGDLWRLAREVRGRYDAVLVAHRSHRSGLLALATGTPRRIGFAGAAGRWAYGETVPWDPARHAAERYGALAVPILGPADAASDARLPVDPARVDRVGRRLALDGRPLAVLAPGSAWQTKRWGEERFAELGRRLAELGWRVVVAGAAEERALCERVGGAARADVVAGDLSLRSTLALLARARVAVCNDSGAAHLAAAAGCPVAVVYGPTVPEMGYTPRASAVEVVERVGLACRPCHRHGPRRCPLGHHDCMRTVEVDATLAAVRRLADPAGVGV